MNKLPDRWLPYSALGQPITGTRFISFKVPLKEAICKKLKPNERFTPAMLLERCSRLGFVVDLTNTERYYDKKEFVSHGVKYEKIFCPGKVIPAASIVQKFFDVVDSFLGSETAPTDSLIGVHCTHGLNRTAYFICSYMIQRMKIPAREAISAFEQARGHRIERLEYVQNLLGDSVPLPLPLSLPLPLPLPATNGYRQKQRAHHSHYHPYREPPRPPPRPSPLGDLYSDLDQPGRSHYSRAHPSQHNHPEYLNKNTHYYAPHINNHISNYSDRRQYMHSLNHSEHTWRSSNVSNGTPSISSDQKGTFGIGTGFERPQQHKKIEPRALRPPSFEKGHNFSSSAPISNSSGFPRIPQHQNADKSSGFENNVGTPKSFQYDGAEDSGRRAPPFVSQHGFTRPVWNQNSTAIASRTSQHNNIDGIARRSAFVRNDTGLPRAPQSDSIESKNRRAPPVGSHSSLSRTQTSSSRPNASSEGGIRRIAHVRRDISKSGPLKNRDNAPVHHEKRSNR